LSKRTSTIGAFAAAGLLALAPAFAQTHAGHDMHAQSTQQTTSPMTSSSMRPHQAA